MVNDEAYPVYNLDQTTGLKSNIKTEQISLWSSNEKASSIVKNFKKKSEITTDFIRACYIPYYDKIGIPEKNQFNTEEEYYSTLFHELVHSTGHPTRLNRSLFLKAIKFGDEEYAKEELVAELGNIFLSSLCGFYSSNTKKNSSAYIKSWIKCLNEDKTLLLTAANQAQKAIEFIQNKKFKSDLVEDEEAGDLGKYKFERDVVWEN